jgi:hypothetical protein
MHFSTYEFCKQKFVGGSHEGHHPLATGLAGICATVSIVLFCLLILLSDRERCHSYANGCCQSKASIASKTLFRRG